MEQPATCVSNLCINTPLAPSQTYISIFAMIRQLKNDMPPMINKLKEGSKLFKAQSAGGSLPNCGGLDAFSIPGRFRTYAKCCDTAPKGFKEATKLAAIFLLQINDGFNN